MSAQMKVEKVKALFNCKYCSGLFSNPVTLPCGVTICESHLPELINSKCTFCQVAHPVPPTGFQVNEVLKQMLDIELNKMQLSPKFEACKEIIGEAKNRVHKIELIKNDPSNYIYEYFQGIKRQVDLRRENLQSAIENYSNEIIQKITETQEKCINMDRDLADITTKFERSKSELTEQIKRFDSFEIIDEKYDEIAGRISMLNPSFNDILEEFQCSLLENSQYEFKALDVNVQEIFGSFISNPWNLRFKDSRILDKQSSNHLIKLCEFPCEQKWSLVYRGSQDGFSSEAFHSKCDGSSNTLTIIKSTNENIFGGYTEKAWSSNEIYLKDENAFIFSLVNQAGKPFMTKCANGGDKAIGGHPAYGVIFGSGNDLRISSNSNVNDLSYSNLGKSYKHYLYAEGSVEAKAILAGSYKFQTTEIEIYTKEKNN